MQVSYKVGGKDSESKSHTMPKDFSFDKTSQRAQEFARDAHMTVRIQAKLRTGKDIPTTADGWYKYLEPRTETTKTDRARELVAKMSPEERAEFLKELGGDDFGFTK